MYTAVYDMVKGYIGERFAFSVFFPSLVFWGIVVLLWYSPGDPGLLIDSWLKAAGGFQLLTSVLFLGWVLFFSLLLSHSTTSLIRLYEGYWEPYKRIWGVGLVVRYLADLRIGHYQKKLDYLYDESKTACKEMEQGNPETVDEAYPTIYSHYPPKSRREHVMPTRLGNVMKSAELYPLVRYNLDSPLLWPRFYHVLPSNMVGLLADATGKLNMMVIVSLLGLVLGLYGGLCMYLGKLSIFVLGVTLGSLLVSWLGYRGAVEAAAVYGSLARSAYDLYRFKLLTALGYKELPTTLKKERELWGKICLFMFRGIPPTDPADFPIYAGKPSTEEANK